MAICPRCNKIITHLEEVRSGVEKSEVFWNKEEKYLDWENEEFEGDGMVIQYYCPECNEELDINEDEVEQFLKNKDAVAEMVAKKIENGQRTENQTRSN